MLNPSINTGSPEYLTLALWSYRKVLKRIPRGFIALFFYLKALVNSALKLVNAGVLEFSIPYYRNSHFIFEGWNGMK
ncbi:hypothetical protein D3C85_1528940 [compost metagenome]